ncbi:MAG: hypothetical protein R2684_02870 [Pyrinomonadaceae bacterium]
MTRKTILLTLIAAFSVASVFAGQPASFKKLAGPATEMDSMRMPSPESEGVRSKTAVIPVRFEKGRVEIDVPIETSDNLRIGVISPEGSNWEIKAFRGDSKPIDLRTNTDLVERDLGNLGIDGLSFPAEMFVMRGVSGSRWKFEITNERDTFRGSTAGFLVITSDSPVKLYSWIGTNSTIVGREIPINAFPYDASASDELAIPPALPGSHRGSIEVTDPRGATNTYKLDSSETGLSGVFTPSIPGQYQIRISVTGIGPKGETYLRTSEQVIQVISDNAQLGKMTVATPIDSMRMEAEIPVTGLPNGRKVIVYGEIFARGDDSTEPVAWIGGMTETEGRGIAKTLPVTIDGRWLANADAKNGFELRNVRIQDPDYFVTIAEAKQMELAVTSLPEAAAGFRGDVNDEMRMGVKPLNPMRDNAAGGVLMLVHGYCSGGNSFPTSQFTGEIVFHDPNANRTHDQFANLIRNFGASYPSFGIVAHSQGGAASLHLYTYYWSGLDYATGNRLIQSVGTPYQGTALAGNLAALGSVFGAGCGTNNNLTYSGASAWLSGIPTWARAKVHYSTTSFKDVWWKYDYCNIATDLFLNDPDDGVIEKTKGQLSGANNRGHKTGWCHTTSMRDPGQTTDSSRNADMNANAAR